MASKMQDYIRKGVKPMHRETKNGSTDLAAVDPPSHMPRGSAKEVACTMAQSGGGSAAAKKQGAMYSMDKSKTMSKSPQSAKVAPNEANVRIPKAGKRKL